MAAAGLTNLHMAYDNDTSDTSSSSHSSRTPGNKSSSIECKGSV